MDTKYKALFSEFSPVSKAEWIEKATADLKGADFNKKLVWKTLNDLEFQPFYHPNDSLEYLANTGKNTEEIINYRSVTVTQAQKANKAALQAIKQGITGIVFSVKSKLVVADLLQGINLNKVAVSFNLETDATQFAADFFDYVAHNIDDNQKLRGYFNLNIITDYVTKGTLVSEKFKVLCYLIKQALPYPNYKAVTVSGTPFINAGSNQVQEVAYTLNALVYMIEQCLDNDIDAEPFFNNLNVQLGIGSEYFIEIAKFRACNSLLTSIAKTYGIGNLKHTVTAQTATWSTSVTDAHTNMLRATTQAMSAILGNVHGVIIDAYDTAFKDTTDFSNRIAGNITTILKEESYFGKVANPTDGAYYIEQASTAIAKNALELFKSIETQGGFYSAFHTGIIQNQIAEIRQHKIKLISQRRLTMVGVNKYPNLMEKVLANTLSSGVEENSKWLTPRRATLEIEAVRRVTEAMVEATKQRPIVELTSFGNLTMRKARAAFAYDFLGVSGFDIWSEKSYTTVTQAAKDSANSASHVVVICSSDQDYDTSALEFVKTFRALNKDKVLLLAGYPVTLIDNLNQAGLNGCIHIKSDIVQTISAIQKQVQKQLNL